MPPGTSNSNPNSGKFRGYKSPSGFESSDTLQGTFNEIKLQQEAVDYYKNVRSTAGFGESEFGKATTTRPKSAAARSDRNIYSQSTTGYSTVTPQLDVYATKKLPPRQYSRIKVPSKGYHLGSHFPHGAGNI